MAKKQKEEVKLWLCQLIQMGKKGSCYRSVICWRVYTGSSSSSKGKKRLSSSCTDGNDLPSGEDEDGDRISDGDRQFCFKSPKGAQRLAGNGFSIGGSGLLEPLRCLVRGREDPLKAKASPPLFGYSREVGHSPDMMISAGNKRRRQLELKDNDENRVSFGGGGGGRATKRVSRNRSLSTREKQHNISIFRKKSNTLKRLMLLRCWKRAHHDYGDPFAALLAVCGQSVPLTLLEVFSKYCEPDNIVKVGEGTYGEAFEAGNTVCKIVPIDGDLPVNGEVQKRSEELLEEVILSRTLNNIRSHDSEVDNACTTFIEILDLRVCEGPYDLALVRAWEYWDERHGSENDHPKEFPEKQCYVVFVLQHGGKDLESFVLLNFDEARSLLVQVTAGLAIAEAAYEFEHRDLHWGNILLCRNDSTTVQFILEGKKMIFRTSGLLISIIDFTLSRINTGQDILFLDLTSDPYLFKGPKGDRQAETYRKMKKVTGDFWEGSFPKTNVLWLIYLVDILLLKKSFDRSSKNEGDLHSLKKRLSKYNSAKEAIILDPFFSNLLVL
ncbi:hypothetical protein D5086_023963 [Populus alba]|uniref:Uncharacterized protein n=1 Tax=Populus alba TaxID=43335 RepID=A0ACC4B462_POPAL